MVTETPFETRWLRKKGLATSRLVLVAIEIMNKGTTQELEFHP